MQRNHLLQSSFTQFMKQQIKAQMCLVTPAKLKDLFMTASSRNHCVFRDSRFKSVQLAWIKIVDTCLKIN